MSKATTILLLSLMLIAALELSHAQAKFWEPTNGPRGGFVSALAVNSTGTIFAATEGGVFRSTNSGENWEKTALTGLSVHTLAIDSRGHLFAGGEGTFRSTDNGDSWQQPTLTTAYISALIINPGGHIFAGTNGGVFRSTDNGTIWTAVNTGLPGVPQIIALAVSGTSLFAGTRSGGVFLSTNNGRGWTPVNNGLPRSGYNTSQYLGVVAFAVSATNLFAGTWGGGVFLSTNNGASWTHAGLTDTSINALVIHPSGSIFAGTSSGILRSTNNGGSWEGLTNLDAYAFAVNPSGDIFAGASNGVFRSTQNGNDWTEMNNGLMNTTVFSLAVKSNGQIFAGTSSSGVFRSKNNGDDWTPTGLASGYCSALTVTSLGDILAAVNGNVYRSTDDGATWTSVVRSLSYITGFAIDEQGNIYIGLGGFPGDGSGGIFRSTDNGQNWVKLGFTIWISGLFINSNGDLLAAGLADHLGIFRSTDSGAHWTPVLTQSGMQFPSSLISDARGNVFWTGADGIFLSTDRGENWALLPGSPTDMSELAVNSLGHLFSGGPNGRGTWRSTDRGVTWASVNFGLANTSVFSLAINSSGVIFVGTEGNGVFRSVQSTTSVGERSAEVPAKFSLEQNFPNPFNPSTRIGYRVSGPGSSWVKLAVSDILGREVATLVNEKKAPGTYEVTWDAAGFASGIYFCRMIVGPDEIGAGSFTETKKLVLTR